MRQNEQEIVLIQLLLSLNASIGAFESAHLEGMPGAREGETLAAMWGKGALAGEVEE